MDLQAMVTFSAAAENDVFITTQRNQSHSRWSIHLLTFEFTSVRFFVFRPMEGAFVNRLAFKNNSRALNSLKAQHLTTSSRDGALRLNFVVKNGKACDSGMRGKKRNAVWVKWCKTPSCAAFSRIVDLRDSSRRSCDYLKVHQKKKRDNVI